MPFWNRNQKNREVSRGGSVILRHRHQTKPRIGFSADSSLAALETREAAYKRLFGEPTSVFHEVIPMSPHIDVYTYGAGHAGRDFYTLVTGGMSDMAMNVPDEADGVPRRVELIFYCSQPKDEFRESDTWFGSGHTIPNGDPATPIWGTAELTTMLLMPTIVTPDNALGQNLQLDGEPVEFLWVVPLTDAETQLKLDRGFGAILDLFGERQHPFVFDPSRKSYV